MVEIKRVDAFVKPDDFVTVTDMGHFIEVQYMQRANTQANIIKLSKTEYADVKTGEIKQFVLSTNRGNNLNSLRQTFKKLMYLINNNFHQKNNELWTTLTYKKNETDLDVVAEDFDKFLKRLKYYSKKRFGAVKGHLEFIKVYEPQARGAWHIHMLVKYPNLHSVFIDNDEFAKLWRQGFVNVQRPTDTDNLGVYLTSYLTNVLYEPEKNTDKSLEKYNKDLLHTPGVTGIQPLASDKSKSAVKGGRLHMYPVGMDIFTKSKGIVYPERKKMKYQDVRQRLKFKDENLTFRKSVEISDEENDFKNIIVIEHYNKYVNKPNDLASLTKWYDLLAQSKDDAKFIELCLTEIDKIENRHANIEKKKNDKIA